MPRPCSFYCFAEQGTPKGYPLVNNTSCIGACDPEYGEGPRVDLNFHRFYKVCSGRTGTGQYNSNAHCSALNTRTRATLRRALLPLSVRVFPAVFLPPRISLLTSARAPRRYGSRFSTATLKGLEFNNLASGSMSEVDMVRADFLGRSPTLSEFFPVLRWRMFM